MDITLPHPPKELNPNASHPVTRQGAIVANKRRISAKQHARKVAYFATLQMLDGKRPPADSWSKYRVTWYYKGICPDDDNVLARCKYYKDGACLALGIDDRTLHLVSIDIVHDKERAGTMTLAIY
jgi:hypothetical protein